MKKITILLVAGLVMTLTTMASAGNKKGDFSVSPVIGGLSFKSDADLEYSTLYGGRLGYNFTDALGIEALFDYARPEFQNESETLYYYRYGGELLYHFMPEKKFVPYIAAGAAGMNFNNDAADTKGGHTKEIFDYGLGAKYFVTEDVAFRVDVRHLFNNDTPGIELHCWSLYPLWRSSCQTCRSSASAGKCCQRTGAFATSCSFSRTYRQALLRL